MHYKFAAFQLYRNGRLIEYQMFLDTFGMAQQLMGRAIDVPTLYP